MHPWTLTFQPGGWAAAEHPDGTFVVLHLRNTAGRWVITQSMMWHTPGLHTGRAWLRVPLRHVERAAAQPAIAALLNEPSTGPAPFGGIDPTIYFQQSPRMRPAAVGAPPPLVYPSPGRGRVHITDDFLTAVARSYLWHVEHGHPPAPSIARNVKRSTRTVHGWILKARKRGLLPPGHPGVRA